MSIPQPKCPVRRPEPCTLCQMGVTGPQDCGLVYLLRDDDDWTQDADAPSDTAEGNISDAHAA